ncbi:hypothetical protein HYPSUDRAFT_202465 [Hypholoma sublateritium FD-334 SS-4]|uniref:Uncharacterized protein n=1 Tax=Hypholoma sublateritium (strain FD-334 SS-4) TaxID=945553 RepID=A0A0D2PPY6_HYPSF|nr:hypothetical protein HYPSUDRAFT_202465 [Hypholoma sublateritium FD-334 SS-4]
MLRDPQGATYIPSGMQHPPPLLKGARCPTITSCCAYEADTASAVGRQGVGTDFAFDGASALAGAQRVLSFSACAEGLAPLVHVRSLLTLSPVYRRCYHADYKMGDTAAAESGVRFGTGLILPPTEIKGASPAFIAGIDVHVQVARRDADSAYGIS